MHYESPCIYGHLASVKLNWSSVNGEHARGTTITIDIHTAVFNGPLLVAVPATFKWARIECYIPQLHVGCNYSSGPWLTQRRFCHGWVNISHSFTWTSLLIHAIISTLDWFIPAGKEAPGTQQRYFQLGYCWGFVLLVNMCLQAQLTFIAS